MALIPQTIPTTSYGPFHLAVLRDEEDDAYPFLWQWSTPQGVFRSSTDHMVGPHGGRYLRIGDAYREGMEYMLGLNLRVAHTLHEHLSRPGIG